MKKLKASDIISNPLFILIVEVGINLIYQKIIMDSLGVLSENYIFNAISVSIIETLLLYSYIKVINEPIKGLVIFLSADILSVVKRVISNETINEALEDIYVEIIIVCIAIIIQLIAAGKIVKTKKIKERIKLLWNYNHKMIKTKIYTKIIVYCTFIIVITTIANLRILDFEMNSSVMQVLASAIVLFPIIRAITIGSTTDIALGVYAAYIICEVGILILRVRMTEFGVNWAEIITIILQALILIQCYRMLNTKEESKDA